MSKAEKAYTDRNRNKGRTDAYVYERTGEEMSWFVPADSLDAMLTFEVRPSDIFLITAAKSGTTWMMHIVSLIMNNANEEVLNASSTSPFNPYVTYPEFYILNHDVQPGYKTLAQMENQRFIPTHLSPNLLPPQVFKKMPKVIYVARNPKDVAVSLYHHFLQDAFLRSYTWEEYLLFSLKGTIRGEWGNHVIPWWEKRNEKNVFFVKYEDMVRDAGCCSTNSDSYNTMEINCKVGGWKDYFTVAQNEEFDEVYKRWIGDSGLVMDFTLP
ncbi:sulfotransferase 1 family member D1-like [Glandiceps talaboti]